MTDMTRRGFVLGSTALGLAGCAQATVARWIAAEQAIGQEFTIVAPELAALGLDVTKATITVAGQTLTIPGIASSIQAATQAFSVATQVSQGQSELVTIETYINALVPVIAPVVTPILNAALPGSGLTIGLIVAAIPAVEGLLNWSVAFGKTLLTAPAQQLAQLAPAAVPMVSGNRGAKLTIEQSNAYLDELLRRSGK